MQQRIKRVLSEPGKYVRLATKMSQQRLCRVFQGGGFFLQGQMDIHPESLWHRPAFAAATGGFFPADKQEEVAREICDLEPWDNTRRDMLTLLLRTIIERNTPGAFAELGVYQGRTARLIHHYAPERALHLFDTFEGFTERGVRAESTHTNAVLSASHFADTSLEAVQAYIAAANGNVQYHKGFFPDTIPDELRPERFAFVHLDADLYEPIREGLRFFYPRMAQRGFILIHDYNAWPGARRAVDEFFADKGELPVPMPDKSGSALIVKQ